MTNDWERSAVVRQRSLYTNTLYEHESQCKSSPEFPEFLESTVIHEQNLLEEWGSHRG